MSIILTIAKKGLKDLFGSPIAYVFITVFLVLSFWLFFSGVFLVGEANMRIFFSWLPLLFLVLLPSVTMGQWAEEKKTGTIELLMTLPASDAQLILGKLVSSLIFLAITLFFTLPLVVVVSRLGDLDMGQVMAAYLGSFLIGGCYLSLGLFISSLAKNQIVAFILTVVSLFFLYLIGESLVTSYLPAGLVPVFQYLSLNMHYTSMARGVIDSRDVLFFISFMVLFLSLNQMSVKLNKG